jgi:hypothetical protein
MNELLQETITAAERAVAGEDSEVEESLARLLNSSRELRSSENSERVYLAALLDFIGMHDEAARVLGDGSDAMSRNMEGMLADAHGQHDGARNILAEALPGSTDSQLLRQQILVNLAAVTLQAGSIGEAEAWIEAAAVAGQTGNPAVDVLIATVRASIASRRGDLPALRGAVASLKEASKSRLAELGAEHPQALAIVANLANAEIMVARADNSAVRLERAIDVLEVAAFRLAAELGADHPQTKTAMASLATVSAEAAEGASAVLSTSRASTMHALSETKGKTGRWQLASLLRASAPLLRASAPWAASAVLVTVLTLAVVFIWPKASAHHVSSPNQGVVLTLVVGAACCAVFWRTAIKLLVILLLVLIVGSVILLVLDFAH